MRNEESTLGAATSEQREQRKEWARALPVVSVLALAELLTMSVWFAPAAVSAALSAQWQLSAAEEAWLTMSVQLGFVGGTLGIALLNLADLLSAPRLFAVSALLAAATNAIPLVWSVPVSGLFCSRFLTGLCMAGVYPPAMKIVASWFRAGRGLALGGLIGALTVGSASPHLLRGTLGADWRLVLFSASTLACVGGVLVALCVHDGPFAFQRGNFRWRRAFDALRRPGVGLASLGYLGHMWELYAMWTWLPVYFTHVLQGSEGNAAVLSFSVIASGAVGCIGAGFLADRLGRTTVAIGAMWISGACALLAGPAAHVSFSFFVLVCLLWGVSVIADSAQFSACVTELSAPDEVGTALTLQNCLGFLLTMVSIRLVPPLQEYGGWTLAFVVLAIGPLLGSFAMMQLRRSPTARVALAGGKG